MTTHTQLEARGVLAAYYLQQSGNKTTIEVACFFEFIQLVIKVNMRLDTPNSENEMGLRSMDFVVSDRNNSVL